MRDIAKTKFLPYKNRMALKCSTYVYFIGLWQKLLQSIGCCLQVVLKPGMEWNGMEWNKWNKRNTSIRSCSVPGF